MIKSIAMPDEKEKKEQQKKNIMEETAFSSCR